MTIQPTETMSNEMSTPMSREVTTLDDLQALRHGAAILTSDPFDRVQIKDGHRFRGIGGFDESAVTLWNFGTKPFVVLFEPHPVGNPGGLSDAIDSNEPEVTA